MSDHLVFQGVKYWQVDGYWQARDGRTLHREIRRSIDGGIPDGMHVHHKDGDPMNNDPSNLEVLTVAEHRRLHTLPKAAEWHRSDEGRAWHRQHGAKTWQDRETFTADCSACGIKYQTFFPTRGQFCSPTCKQRGRRARLASANRSEKEGSAT